MSMRYQAAILTASYFPLKTPDAPTIGTATAGNASASVTFTAPANVGGGAITGYTVTSSPGGLTGTGASSPITVSGLSNFTSYTFTVVATNAFGTGPRSAASNSATPAPPNQVAYTTAGTYTFVAPAGLNPATVSVVCVGGGGGGYWAGFGDPNYSGACGGGGGLGYINGYSVTAGNSYTVVVGAGAVMSTSAIGQTSGGDSYFVSTGTVKGGGGVGGSSNAGGNAGAGTGGTYTGTGGGNGGNGSGAGYYNSSNYWPGGGGGAGGYAGNGGEGASSNSTATAGSAGSGGGGGGASSGYGSIGGYGGGGVGILGQGSNGVGGSGPSGGGGGSGGEQGTGFAFPNVANGGAGGAYGGGGGGANPSTGNGGTHNGGVGGVGAVRIIYSFSGVTRSFPSTNTGDL